MFRFFIVFYIFLSTSLYSSAAISDPNQEDSKFQPGEMIMHHILDSHDWHILDWKGHAISIPLPVILYHKGKGFSLFMSSKFNHGHDTHWVSDTLGYRLSHGKIICEKKTLEELQLKKLNLADGRTLVSKSPTIAIGSSLMVLGGQKTDLIDGQHLLSNGDNLKVVDGRLLEWKEATTAEEETGKLLDLSITKNVFSLLISIFLLLFIFIKISNKYKKHTNKAPSGIQSLLEPIIIFVRDDIAKSAIGEKNYQRYLPFLLTVFFFIFLNNLLGLVPFFPGGANLTGNIAVPMVMAGMVFVITTISGKKYYWKHIFAMPGVPKPVLLILTPIEIFGVFLKPLVLMIRLFANITAGHIIILSFFSMIFIFGEMSPVAGYGVSVFSGLFVLFMMTLELLVAFLQAYVFTLLAAMYFGMAVEEH